MMAFRADCWTEKLTSCRAVTPPKRSMRCEMSRMGPDIPRKTTCLLYTGETTPGSPKLESASPRRDSRLPSAQGFETLLLRFGRGLLVRSRRRSRRRRLLRLLLDALGHHPDGPPRRRIPDRVQRLHRPDVLRLVIRVEEDDGRTLRRFLALRHPEVRLEPVLGGGVGERLVVQVPDPGLVHLEDHLRQVRRRRLVQHLRRGLLRDADADLLLHQRREDHEDDQEHQHHVDQRRDVDVRARALAGADGHCHGYGAPFSSSAASETPLSFALEAQSSTGRTLPYSTSVSALIITRLPASAAPLMAAMTSSCFAGVLSCSMYTLPSLVTLMNAGSAPWPVTACFALGSSTLFPRWSMGVTTMKMMRSTRTTSTSGVMLMSERTPLFAPTSIPMAQAFAAVEAAVVFGLVPGLVSGSSK